jgi:hypothetical protein
MHKIHQREPGSGFQGENRMFLVSAAHWVLETLFSPKEPGFGHGVDRLTNVY